MHLTAVLQDGGFNGEKVRSIFVLQRQYFVRRLQVKGQLTHVLMDIGRMGQRKLVPRRIKAPNVVYFTIFASVPVCFSWKTSSLSLFLPSGIFLSMPSVEMKCNVVWFYGAL